MKVETQERIRKIREKNLKYAVAILVGFILIVLNIIYSPTFINTTLVWVIGIALIIIILFSLSKLQQADSVIKNIFSEEFETEYKLQAQFTGIINLSTGERVEGTFSKSNIEITDLNTNISYNRKHVVSIQRQEKNK
ncbi:hypothetical protein [Chryseobacterium oncorhynchi]|uniref:Uncharacterized protein n=1 Tax=Chryseobacterium oncorhynchi TaxID=741074 RepID=A0A316WLA3_9FLAO|nr:hypothetical protein [Chryseobacterium oncorhynchi]PWN59220.1 hypothetical protein C1638_021675 [Chryseobacterium oncorhynchi]